MSDADRVTLQYIGYLASQAIKNGDTAKVTYYHDQAEALRHKYGYCGGADGSGDYPWSGGSCVGYAKGLEQGPVTYTGLAMLHGTPSEPEYVVNSDQAYNMLYNLSRTRMPEFTSNFGGNSGTVYTLNGDVIIDGTSDPREFWNQVSKNMQNRSNVTKNKSGSR